MIGALAGTDQPAAGALITDRSWFDRPALEVAPDLLGMELIHHTPEGPIAGRLVEVEAYQGPEDLAAHSSRGRTPRNAVMFGAPGHLYVYLIYGLHLCANVVCGPGTKPEAVLLRAARITAGPRRWRAGAVATCRTCGWRRARATWAPPSRWSARWTAPTSWPDRCAWRVAPGRPASSGLRGSAWTTPANGRRGRCASRSLMTRTAPDAEPAAGAAADPGTLRALEFGAIVGMLGELTAFGPSRELAEATLPMADATHVALLQDQTDEAVRLLDDQAQASIGGARDVRAPIGRARRGGRLTALELLDVAETARAADLFGARLAGWKAPHLAELRDELDPAPALRERIERSVDESGEVLDSASAELAAIRKRLRTAQDRVRERLNAMLHSADLAGVIGEAIVTQRSGRYVIPIRAEAKGKVKGIVHDQSASGATLFVEPLTVVELNNTWTQATLDAAREEERILDELSRAVEERAESLLASLAALARADLWLARARLAAQLDAVRPAATDDAAELLSARHPLLGQGAVPIDLRLGERFGYRALVVTGPNTGGKTVSLKTLGLLALMHQAGLRVPAADGARLPVFRRVMADIGDEQSIAQSLSTFSSHLRNVVRFVAAAGPGTLVLLDEVGRRDRSHGGLGPGHGRGRAAARAGRLGGGHHPLRGAQDVRPGASAGQQCLGRLRRGHPAAHLPARDRAAGQVAGLRHRRAPGPA